MENTTSTQETKRLSKSARRDLWYERVNDLYKTLPLYTFSKEEMERAGRKLYRFLLHGYKGKSWGKRPVRFVTGNRYTYIKHGEMLINVSNGMTGFRGMIHLLSHYGHHFLYPYDKGHATSHARLEMKCLKMAIARGWFTGALKSPEKPVVIAAPVSKIVPLQARLARWTMKQKRATTAIKKLTKQIRYYEKKENTQHETTNKTTTME